MTAKFIGEVFRENEARVLRALEFEPMGVHRLSRITRLRMATINISLAALRSKGLAEMRHTVDGALFWARAGDRRLLR